MVADKEWRIRASLHDKLVLEDPNGLRREYIAELLKRDAAGLAALNVLGGDRTSPPLIYLKHHPLPA